DYTVGAMVGHQMLLFSALAAAIMNMLMVSRHTRDAEEEGRQELIRSFSVGRLANLRSQLTLSVSVNLALALLIGISLFACGVPCGVQSVDLPGSLLYGVLVGAAGFIFSAITALLAQLAQTSRGTLGYAFAALGLAYLMRAVGDVGPEALSLGSPLGLILRSQVYVNNLWWPVLLVWGISAVLWWGAFELNSRRDLGAGLIPSKAGRSHASALLSTPLGLALRLQQTTVLGWLCGLFILGMSYGSVFGDLEMFLAGNEFLRDILPATVGFSLTEQFLGMIILVMAMLAVVPALLTVGKLRKEEQAGRLEHLLARGVSRQRLVGSFIALSVLVGVVSMVLSSLGLWAAANAVMETPIEVKVVIQAGLAQLPAIAVMIGFAVLLIGFWPKGTGLVWAYLGYSIFAVYFGILVQLPQWMASLSPFGHSPQMPVEPFDPPAAIGLLVVSVLLSALGVQGYKKRDMQN
ncbi:MAG TPA: ABC transporter permease, partial [Firmicutes bacterium]|nr:ABC transporter permease [Bacillota bacterium]